MSAKETESESFSLLEKGTPTIARKNSADQTDQKYEVCFENITQQVDLLSLFLIWWMKLFYLRRKSTQWPSRLSWMAGQWRRRWRGSRWASLTKRPARHGLTGSWQIVLIRVFIDQSALSIIFEDGYFRFSRRVIHMYFLVKFQSHSYLYCNRSN